MFVQPSGPAHESGAAGRSPLAAKARNFREAFPAISSAYLQHAGRRSLGTVSAVPVRAPNTGVAVRPSQSLCSALVILLLLAGVPLAYAHDFSASVVKVRAVSSNGSVQVGSGVVTEPGKVATACHVTRGATRIEIEAGAKRVVAEAQVGSQLHDLCVLTAPTFDAPAASLRRSEDLRAGEVVVAIGFQGGAQPVERRGSIAALYPYDGGHVIRTTASFDFGASGGGLFDQAGNLVGLLAFKARTGDSLRFALPTEWLSPESEVAHAFVRVTPTAMNSAFWERSPSVRPAFLGVAKREAEDHVP
jgi:serine protease Do